MGSTGEGRPGDGRDGTTCPSPANRAFRGEEQRIALARALVHHPAYMFADEPTAELDHTRSIRLMERLRRFQETHGSTIIMTTHDPELLTFADQVYELGQASLRTTVPS